MSQQDFDIATADANSGPSMRAAINAELQALASNNSGTTAPTTTYAYMWWADVTTGKLWQRNAANSGWIDKGLIADQSVHASTSKTTPVNADEIGLWDSAASVMKKLTWANLVAKIAPRYGVPGVIATTPYVVDSLEGLDVNMVFAVSGICTITLPAAASYSGRTLNLKNHASYTVISASSNVKPLTSGTAGTAILAATPGKWATLVSDGTYWIIMAGN